MYFIENVVYRYSSIPIEIVQLFLCTILCLANHVCFKKKMLNLFNFIKEQYKLYN